MRAEVHHRPAAVLVEPAPVEVLLRVLVAVLREDLLLRRLLVGEEGGERAVPLRVGGRHAAEHVGDDVLEAVAVARVGAALVADLEELARLLLHAAHLGGLLELVRHLLLAVHMLARAEAGARVFAVHPVGRRDHDRVDVLVLLFEHLAVVLVRLHVHTVPLEKRLRLLALELPDVAHGAHAHAGDAHERLGEDARLLAEADEAYVDLVVLRTDRGVLGVEDVEARQERSRGGGALNETAAVQIEFHLSFLTGSSRFILPKPRRARKPYALYRAYLTVRDQLISGRVHVAEP